MIRKLHVAIPESTLRRLDRISPLWAESFRRGEIPCGDVCFGGKYDGRLDITRSNCCVVGESKGWDSALYFCISCSVLSGDLVNIYSPDWLADLEGFITHYEQAHMKEPEKERVLVEVEQA